VFIAVAGPSLSVDRLLGHSFKTRDAACDCLKVGRDEAETYFQEVAWHFICASRTIDGQRRSHNCDKHDSDHLRMQCIRRRALKYLEARPLAAPFASFSGGYLQAGYPRYQHGTSPNGTVSGGALELLAVHGCVACSEVAYRRIMCEFEWSFGSR